MSGENLLPCSQRLLLLCPYVIERAKELSGGSFTGALIPFMGALPPGSNHLPKAPPPDTITLGIRFQPMNLAGGGGGGTQIQCKAFFITWPPPFFPPLHYLTSLPQRCHTCWAGHACIGHSTTWWWGWDTAPIRPNNPRALVLSALTLRKGNTRALGRCGWAGLTPPSRPDLMSLSLLSVLLQTFTYATSLPGVLRVPFSSLFAFQWDPPFAGKI